MERDAQPTGSRSDSCLITDLNGVPLGKLAMRAADGEGNWADTVDRILEGAGRPSQVRSLRFSSAI